MLIFALVLFVVLVLVSPLLPLNLNGASNDNEKT